MKNLLKFAVLSLFLAFAAACDDDKTEDTAFLPVNSNNIAGTWQLAEFSGEPLAENSYVYLNLIRKDNLFEIYQNLDSFQARKLTGRYALVEDAELGTIIRGMYDHGTGDWAHRYIIRDLTAERMVWIAQDDPEDVSIYVRCAGIPDEITGTTEE